MEAYFVKFPTVFNKKHNFCDILFDFRTSKPRRKKFFPFSIEPFSEGDCCKERQNRKSQKFLLCNKWWKIYKVGPASLSDANYENVIQGNMNGMKFTSTKQKILEQFVTKFTPVFFFFFFFSSTEKGDIVQMVKQVVFYYLYNLIILHISSFF